MMTYRSSQLSVYDSPWGAPGGLFCTAAGAPLTKARFVELVRLALMRAGVAVAGYSGHSFSIGVSTTAAQAGISDSTIQALGTMAKPGLLRLYMDAPGASGAVLAAALAEDMRCWCGNPGLLFS